MSEGLVSALLTRLDEIERPEIAARGDHNLRWTLSGETTDATNVECLYCDWSLDGLEHEVDPLADEHAVQCVSMPISEVLRLCRAHRQIIDMHQRDIRQVWSDEADDLVDVPFCRKCAWGESCACCADDEDYQWPCDTLKALAVGLGGVCRGGPEVTDELVDRLRAVIDGFDQCAIAAGHGFGHRPLGHELNAEWTQLDLSDNVRPTYDQRFLRECGPKHVQRMCVAHRRVLREYEEAAAASEADPSDISAKVAKFALGLALEAIAAGYGVVPGSVEEKQ